MITLSAFDPLFGDWSDIENKKNILALFVVVKFFVVIGFVSFLVWTIRRNAARQCLETAELLDELEQAGEAENSAPGRSSTEKPEGWEREADWWKK